METIRLSKSWGKHPAGAKLDVDPARAAQLRKDGFVAANGDGDAKKTGRKKASAEVNGE